MRHYVKYPNRRLYDRHLSAYATLQEVRQVVESGEEICVTRKKDGTDITREILFAVLAAQDRLDIVTLLGLIRHETQ